MALPHDGGSGVVIVRYDAEGLAHVDRVEAAESTVTPGEETTDSDGTAAFLVSHGAAETVTYTASIDGVAVGSVAVTYEEQEPPWEQPDPDGQGSFTVSSYAGSDVGESGSRWWRGYVFTVTEDTEVTHLVGSGTEWSTVGLFEAATGDDGHLAKPQDDQAWEAASTHDDGLDALALGWVRIEGDVTDEPQALTEPVTLQTGTEHLLAQSAASEDGSYEEAHHNRYVERIDRDDLLSHPRVGETWVPETNESLRWEGSDAETIAGGHKDSDELMPLVGFLYNAEAEPAAVTTSAPETEAFAGTLTSTGGSETRLCLDVGETEADYERRPRRHLHDATARRQRRRRRRVELLPRRR